MMLWDRIFGFLLLACLVFLSPIDSKAVRAAQRCSTYEILSEGIYALTRNIRDAHRGGRGALRVEQIMVGLTNISPQDYAKLSARKPVEIVRSDARSGSFKNEGMESIEVEGNFLRERLVFRLPKYVEGTYEILSDGIQYSYAIPNGLKIGKKIFGIPILKDVDRVKYTDTSMHVFLKGNATENPDRCYIFRKFEDSKSNP
jgi:hypothetical protein